MIHSSQRKLALSGWLQDHDASAYSSPLRLQKFLFFYESLSKVEGDVVEFSGLKGYKRGPVFSAVWGDYTKDKEEFQLASSVAYKRSPESIADDRAKLSAFIVDAFSEDELSEMSHRMNIWKNKEPFIMKGVQQVSLDEADFSQDDAQLIHTLKEAFPLDFIEHTRTFHIGNVSFVFTKADAAQLTEENYDTLYAIAKSPDIENPVYVSIDDGVLIVD